jgi:Domain of unknown function (DUF4263)
VLIEIEAPQKKWYTAKGQPTAQLTQAASQLTDWKAWFKDPNNVLTFEKEYKVREYPPLNDRTFTQCYCLVIGRRSDVSGRAATQSRVLQQRENEHWMTYDRLQPHADFDDSPTVTLDRSGPDTRLRVLHVPPTMRIGPGQYPSYHTLMGLDAAIAANTLISKERKAFLLRRLKYWKEWFENPPTQTGYSSSQDIIGE